MANLTEQVQSLMTNLGKQAGVNQVLWDEGLKGEDEKEVHEEEVVKENNDLITLSVDLVMKVDMLEKERDLALKIAQELSKLVEKQEEEFARKTRKMQMEAEKKNALKRNIDEHMVCNVRNIWSEEYCSKLSQTILQTSSLQADVLQY
ncbi:hypothetical protein QYF36_024765 [Acer negundo]|nr:hypothetical protein QYF36_024765 [Acer negundo]